MNRRRPADETIQDALAQVRAAFAPRPRPLDVSYCTHCFEPAWMERFLATDPAALSVTDLNDVLWSALTTWGDWPALAYYVPRLLEVHVSGELYTLSDDDYLLYKLIEAAVPSPGYAAGVGTPMHEAEREAIAEHTAPAEVVARIAGLADKLDQLPAGEAYWVEQAFDVAAAMAGA